MERSRIPETPAFRILPGFAFCMRSLGVGLQSVFATGVAVFAAAANYRPVGYVDCDRYSI
jgi:hypothetical protein